MRPNQRSEVDIRVMQEIKNHNDLMHEMGQSIQTLQLGLTSLAGQHQKALAKSDNDHKMLLIAFENLKEGVDLFVKKSNQRIGDIETSVNDVLNKNLKMHKEMPLDYLSRNDFIDAIRDQDKITACLQQDVTVHKDGFNSAIVALNHKLKDEIERLRIELTPSTQEVDPIKSQLEAASVVWKIDFDGLVKEIAILKKSATYAEKKFENLYTLIDRLKGEMGDLFHKKV